MSEPKIRRSAAKTEVLSIRLTPGQKMLCDEQATRDGQSLGEWAEQTLMARAAVGR